MDPVRVYWWRPVSGTWRQKLLDLRHLWTIDRSGKRQPPWRLRNFGDELTAAAFAVTGHTPTHADARSAELFLLGSVLQRAALEGRAGACVAGPGLAPGLDRGFLDRVRERSAGLDIRAVRGPLTRDALGLSKRLPLGDGALLLRGHVSKVDGDGRGVLVAHYRALSSDARLRALTAIAERLDTRIVVTADSSDGVVRAISGARFVVSTSLHGLVVADLLGVPALAVTEGSQSLKDYRFVDYGQSVQRDAICLPLARLTRSDVEQSHEWDRPDAPLLDHRAAELADVVGTWLRTR